jgi:hypothetical protein
MMSEKQMVSLWVTVRVFTLQCDSLAALEAFGASGVGLSTALSGAVVLLLLQQES